MNVKLLKIQSGFALLIFLVILMGMGGLLLTGFSQQALKGVEAKRFEHNKRVLQEAKQALLMYAYNYPMISLGTGPGRLPCSDTDNDGDVNTNSVDCVSIGRFPWKNSDLNTPEFKDASGEHLWYAVSATFATNVLNNSPQVPNSAKDASGRRFINSDVPGTITIFDQSGQTIYDGSSNGIAAVIIAPGAIISRDDDNDANSTYEYQQTRNTAAERLVEKNYLDTFNGFDNSIFKHIENDSNDDGFILGPVYETDPNSPAYNTVVVNDQIIVITAAEVVEMAEKATLEAYKNGIRGYQQNIWGATTANYRYPWLDLYEGPDGLITYDANIKTVISDPMLGRVPSMFSNYFDGSGPSVSIESRLHLDVLYDGLSWLETSPVANVSFDNAGNLISDTNFEPGERTFYLWDGHATTPDVNSPRDGIWELCVGNAGTGASGTGDQWDNCNRRTNGTFKADTDTNPDVSDVWLEVKRITVDFNDDSNNLTFLFADIQPTNLTYDAPTASDHAIVYADFDANASYLDIFDTDFITNKIDEEYLDEDFGDKSGTVDGPAWNNAADRIRVGIRFYPVLPSWANNGDPAFTGVNFWHDDVMLAYSSAFKPNGDGSCTLPAVPFVSTTNLSQDYCLLLENSGGVQNDKKAVLLLAGRNTGLVDSSGSPTYYADDLEAIFEGENGTPAIRHDDGTAFWSNYYNPAPAPANYELLEANLKFDRRPANDSGNDIVLALD